MMSASFSAVSTRCSELGSCNRKRKHVSAWTRSCPSFADEPLCTAKRNASFSTYPSQGTGFRRQASSAPLTRSIALAARPHSIDSDSVELVLCGPCRRLAHSIKKELPLDPVSLTLYPPKHRVPNDASQKVLSLSSSQSSFHDERPSR